MRIKRDSAYKCSRRDLSWKYLLSKYCYCHSSEDNGRFILGRPHLFTYQYFIHSDHHTKIGPFHFNRRKFKKARVIVETLEKGDPKRQLQETESAEE